MERKDFTDYKVFKCYSNKLKWHLLTNGERYVDISSDDNGKYWLFIRNENLSKLLDSYSPVKKQG